MQTPSFKEDHSSQIPALQTLIKLGYTYLSPAEALMERQNKEKNVLLESTLRKQLARINTFRVKGRDHKFSDNNIQKAIEALEDFPLKDGLIRTNEQIFELISSGKSLEERVNGDKKSYDLRYIDWEKPHNNVFQVTEEFSVDRMGGKGHYRPDLVLFVNGIPLVVIECKRPDLDKPISQAIQQHLRNQLMEGIPQLFMYSQLLVSLSGTSAQYGTTGSTEQYWSQWKEQLLSQSSKEAYGKRLQELKNTPLSPAERTKLFSDRFRYVAQYFEHLEMEELEVTAQDELLYNLCRPERLHSLIRRFIINDAGIKKIARYQQYFAVENTLQRIAPITGGKRQGGVIWHTQGSGKSLTMVMMGKSLALEPQIKNPLVILVTDRIQLDDQIYGTFQSCGIDVVQAQSGEDLITQIKEGKADVITTLVFKFQSGAKKEGYINESPNIFVLIDESHRSQYGEANVKMQKVLPNACFIGFTGTPLMKREKNTANRFGGMIDKYTIDQAVEDGAVVPLLYEGRHVLQEVQENLIDKWFERKTKKLSPEQKVDLKKKFSRADQLNEADLKIQEIVEDITEHWQKNWQGSGFKAQLTAPSKAAALKYQKAFSEQGEISTEVIISAPDLREGTEDIYESDNETTQRFWQNMMQRFGNEKEYNKKIVDAFKGDGNPEIIIVVDKLLTGFDAPRNLVLYITRNLREHTLLQAIARVNRLFEGKDFGYIVDYYGVLGELDSALTTYSSLSEFDEEDLKGALVNVKVEVEKLPERHAQLRDLFKGVKNQLDYTPYLNLLEEVSMREEFYSRLSLFARTLKLALSTVDFDSTFSEARINRYKEDAKFFLKLRKVAKQHFAEEINYKQYEKQIQKLINTHVSAEEVIQITELINIFDHDRFQEEVERVEGTATKAETIANRMSKQITEIMDKDPAYYKKFSELLKQVIADMRLKRITDAEGLDKVTQMLEQLRNRERSDIPSKLQHHEDAQAYFGIIEPIVQTNTNPELSAQAISADIALKIESIIDLLAIVDWKGKSTVENKMRQGIEDHLFSIKGRYGIDFSFSQMDTIMDDCLDIAKNRK